MLSELKSNSLFEDYINEQTPLKQENYIIKSIRQTASKFYNGIPTKKNSNYKYSNLHKHLNENFQFNFTPKVPSVTLEETENAYKININDDTENIIPELSKLKLILINKDQTDDAVSQILKNINVSVNNFTDPYKLLNLANNNNPIYLEIFENNNLKKPIYITCNFKKIDSVVIPSIYIKVGQNSSATIINEINDASDNIFVNSVLHVSVLENAKLDYGFISNTTLDSKLSNVNNLDFHLYQNSNLFIDSFSSGKNLRNNINIHMNGKNSYAKLNGIYCLRSNEHIDNHTVVKHLHPNTYSSEIYKGVLSDSATGVFNGKIYVKKDAQKINALQTNNNILLSKNSKVYTKPQLEIFADDVKCSHGATIGSIDKNYLFYLQSRGIDKKLGTKMLVAAFLKQIVDQIKNETLSHLIQYKLDQKINQI